MTETATVETVKHLIHVLDGYVETLADIVSEHKVVLDEEQLTNLEGTVIELKLVLGTLTNDSKQ